MKKTQLILPMLALVAGCGSSNSYLAKRTSTVEMYHIFDIKTEAATGVVIKAAADGLARNTNEIQQNTPLQLGKTVPVEPGRFVIEDIGAKLAGSNTGMGAMMQMAAMKNGAISLKAAKCDDAVWTSRALRNIAGSSNLTLYSCLYKYQAGYRLNTYAVFNKTEGGLAQVSRDIATSLVGTPEQWVTKTILDTVHSIESATGVKAVRLEGQPELVDLPSGALVGKN
ncbi:hypothetical protein [Pseudoduganella chitinolytica]|uniref:Lipoprotein n=1 Tax=Pseudoduganella chitinolytica TaxID=34070 RepID=A0ABY8BGX1_9BURK|nr:hypothetical protein [Pseudoduganella chitinolytica]WEF33534.1 hypothetical protein PX653_01705 [Pseudoduganella chitinolytica]